MGNAKWTPYIGRQAINRSHVRKGRVILFYDRIIRLLPDQVYMFGVSCRSTKKLLCKWDASTSKIVRIEDLPTSTSPLDVTSKEACVADLPPTKDNLERVRDGKRAKHQVAKALARIKKEVSEKEKLAERLQAESVENAELDALCFGDVEDCGSLMGDDQAIEDVAACIPDASSSGHILSDDCISALETENAGNVLIPERPKSLDTVANVEQAIIREKRLTLLRYQAGMRRIKGLEILLKRLQEPQATKSDSSPENLVLYSSPLNTKKVASPVSSAAKTPTKLSSPFLALLKSSIHPVTPNTFPSPKTKSVSEIDLPPPLFDDYH